MSGGGRQRQVLAGLAVGSVLFVGLAAIAVDQIGAAAIGALLGMLVVLAVLGLRQQARYAKRSAADFHTAAQALDAVDQRITRIAKNISKISAEAHTQSKDVRALTKTVTTWSKDVKVAEIESGIAALNRYVALGSNDTSDPA